jgi:hypothetical protein
MLFGTADSSAQFPTGTWETAQSDSASTSTVDQRRQQKSSPKSSGTKPTSSKSARPRQPWPLLRKIVLEPFRYRITGAAYHKMRRAQAIQESVKSATAPYKFARKGFSSHTYLDLSQDANVEELQRRNLPVLRTPQDLANWLNIPLGKLAWLMDRFTEYGKPNNTRQSHYHYRWLPKKKGGYRMLEIPKQSLKQIQSQILVQILDRCPPHSSAHGFNVGCSIVTNATPHVDQNILVKYDLDNFYTRIRFSRVVAIYRTLGFSREVSLWLTRLTTTAAPTNLITPPDASVGIVAPYTSRHLPQGAPTSPALANLSAYSLDVRLTGMAHSFGAVYTRYADDLTFSGDHQFKRNLSIFIPLVEQIISAEKFLINKKKRKFIRQNQRQTVTGIVVNSHLGINRKDFDKLKATLTNCIRLGAESQNREKHPQFAQSLLGKIAHVSQVNAKQGAKLSALYAQIKWN